MLIAAVSYDSESLNRRIMAFQNLGHVVVPASSLTSCLSVISLNNYDVLVIGATVPVADGKTIISASREFVPQVGFFQSSGQVRRLQCRRSNR